MHPLRIGLSLAADHDRSSRGLLADDAIYCRKTHLEPLGDAAFGHAVREQFDYLQRALTLWRAFAGPPVVNHGLVGRKGALDRCPAYLQLALDRREAEALGTQRLCLRPEFLRQRHWTRGRNIIDRTRTNPQALGDFEFVDTASNEPAHFDRTPWSHPAITGAQILIDRRGADPELMGDVGYFDTVRVKCPRPLISFLEFGSAPGFLWPVR